MARPGPVFLCRYRGAAQRKVSELVVKSQAGSDQLKRVQAPAFPLDVGCDTASGGGERHLCWRNPRLCICSSMGNVSWVLGRVGIAPVGFSGAKPGPDDVNLPVICSRTRSQSVN